MKKCQVHSRYRVECVARVRRIDGSVGRSLCAWVGPKRATRMRRAPAVMRLVSRVWLDLAVLRQLADERAKDPPPTGVGKA
jgi:hypothetical protein